MRTDMLAAVCPRYGPPEVIELQQRPRPVASDAEVLIRVRATTVGPADCAFRSGTPAVARLYSGLRKPKLSILGDAVAGDIVTVGGNVRRFAESDRVFGLSPKRLGGHGEYLCLPEEALLERMPAAMGYNDAVSILEAATALTFLRDVADLQPGQTALINGASGSVGGYAVQLAKHFGAYVTGVCSSRNVALVASLGADELVDYTAEDFTENGRQYDVIFDAVGESSFARCKGSLAPTGLYLTTVPKLASVVSMLATAMGRGKKAKFAATGLMQNNKNLTFLAELFISGTLRPVIDRRYELTEITEAYRYVETGRKTGTAVITL